MEDKSNKRILKNTLFLYLRMFISMGISIFTGRIVLRTLGVEDYGINNLVGGVVGMFCIIQTSMIGATSRFITFEIGKGDRQRLKDTFSTALNVHIIIGLVLVFLLETIGLWFINTQLVIPANRLFAANVVFHASVFSVMFGVTQAPYNACMVAHESFDVYAYFDILNLVLKLVILYVLLIWDVDKLILYGFLTLVVSLFMMMLNRFYCIRHFEEAHFQWLWNKDIIKPMLSFSGWDFFGNMAVIARGEGVSMVLNMFFGPIMNAAAGIATTVQNAVGQFSSNIILAARPQLIKRYADGDFDSMKQLMSDSVRLSFILLTCLTVPLVCEIHFVLNLWLGIVPDMACEFTVLALIFNVVGVFTGVTVIVIHASARMKGMSLTNGLLYVMVLPVSVIAFKLGAPAWVPFLYNVCTICVSSVTNSIYVKCSVPSFHLREFLVSDCLRCVCLFFTVTVAAMSLHDFFTEGWLRLILSVLLTVAITAAFSYKFMLTKHLRMKAIQILKEKMSYKL